MLIARIAETVPGVTVVPPELPPACGAALEAMKSLGLQPGADCLARLREQAVDLP
jgi:hypothetical protein